MMRIATAYAEWDPELDPTVWAVVKKWLQERGVKECWVPVRIDG